MQPQSRIGHGRLGLRSNQRGLDELLEQSYCGKHSIVDFQAGKQVELPWATDGTNVYSKVLSEFHPIDGHLLDIVSVQTEAGDTLSRGERLLTVTNNQNHYFYDLDATVPTLFVHLTGNADPNSVAVMVLLGLRFASGGFIEPTLSPDRFFPWGWSSPTTLTNYFEDNVGATGVKVDQETSDRPYESTDDPAKISPGASGLDAGFTGGIRAFAQGCILGSLNVVSGWYQTSVDLPADGHAALIVDYTLAGGGPMLNDGRNMQAGSVLRLDPTGGEWRRYHFWWRCPITVTNLQMSFVLFNSGGSPLTAGHVKFAPPKTQRVWRFEFCEPRLDRSSVPPMEIGAGDPAFGSQETGLGALKLLNSDDGYLETVLGSYNCIGRSVRFNHLGAFADGQEVTFEDALPGFTGTVDELEVNDIEATLPLQNARSLMSVELPLRIADKAAYPNMAEKDVGRPRGLLFGTKRNIAGIRTSYQANTELPIFEVCDVTGYVGPEPLHVLHAYAYLDENAAGRKDATKRVELLENIEFTIQTLFGQVTITGNPGIFVIVAGVNDRLDFVANSVTYAAVLTAGLYTAETLRIHAQAQMRAIASTGSINVTYSNSTHRYTMQWTDVGNFQLLLDTGTNVQRSAFPLMGYTADTDKTGLTSYASDEVLYDVSRVDTFTIRFDAEGFDDDTTFTGGSGRIEKGPDILHFLWRRVLNRPASEIDLPSFVAGRTSTPQILGAYIGGLAAVNGGSGFTLTVQEVTDRIEVSCHADAILDGQGKLYWKPRPTTTAAVTALAATAPILYDRDFLEFSSGKSSEDVYASVRINYNQDPSTGVVQSVQAHLDTVTLFHGSQRPKVFDSFLLTVEDAGPQAWNMMLLHVLPRRNLNFRIKGRLLRKLIADLVRVQRSRMLPAELATMANADVFRLLRLRFDPQTHDCYATVYTADLPRNAGAIEPKILAKRVSWEPLPWAAASRRGLRQGGMGLR